MSERTCPTCSRATDADSEGLVQARIASRPDSGPAQARHIADLEAENVRLQARVDVKQERVIALGREVRRHKALAEAQGKLEAVEEEAVEQARYVVANKEYQRGVRAAADSILGILRGSKEE